MVYIIVILVWITCAIIAYGFLFGYCQKHRPEVANRDYWDNFTCSLVSSFLLGPVSLIIVLGLLIFLEEGTLKHGLKFLVGD